MKQPPPNTSSESDPSLTNMNNSTMDITISDSSSSFPQLPDNMLPQTRIPFGRPMRSLFNFSPSYHPLNHGSYGTFPRYVLETKIQKLREFESRPSIYRTFVYPSELRHSRSLVAPFLGADVDEVVLVPNATTGINVVLRNILPDFGKDDVVVYPSTIYPSCLNTFRSVLEEMKYEEDRFGLVEVKLEYPVSDEDLVGLFKETIGRVQKEGKRVRLAIFDTIVSGPGARVPWERLVQECRELGVLSLVDGAHGIGHIDLTETGRSVRPDFMVTNCHKWLFVPRGCAVLYVPFENQGLIKTALPTSHGYLAPELRPHYLGDEEDTRNIFEGEFRGQGGDKGKWSDYFTNLFVDVATVDCSSYTCIQAAIDFRNKVCGGEEAIREYCFRLAFQGGNRAAEILGTEVMDVQDITGCGNLRRCNFANVRLPLTVVKKGGIVRAGDISEEDVRNVTIWLYRTVSREYDTYLQTFYIGGSFWTRFSAQIYLEVADFEWGARTLLEICGRIKKGEWKGAT